jgi:gamma-glutamyltranspeptidase/glutathione hydrolase
MTRRFALFGLGLALGVLAVARAARSQEAAKSAVGDVPQQQIADGVDWQAAGTHGAVAAGGRGAVAAGMEILKSGGNAADAAAATILALSVTDARSFCFGGEVPILVYDSRTRSVTVIAGQGAAPRLATREEFLKRGRIPLRGILAAAVPAALDACLTLLDRFGTMTFKQVVAPTQHLLAGLPRPQTWHADLGRTLKALVDAEACAHPTGAGPSLAPLGRSRGLRLVADSFYRGSIARRIDAWSRASGGLIRYVDLATHTTRVEEPVAIDYRGLTVYKCGPWTQGPSLLQALQILKDFDLAGLGHNRVDAIHAIVETLKLAMADRDTYYADPLFVDVPLVPLLSPEYAALRRGLIDPKTASAERRPGDPLSHRALLEPVADPAQRHVPSPLAAVHDTTTCVVADRFGNVVAATPSGWSGVVAGDTGVWLGSRLQSFNLWNDHPDVIEPGKRPRITLSPTVVLRNGRPVLAVSVAGGDNQDQMTLQLVLNHVDFGLEPARSVVAPRFMTDHFIGSFGQKPPVLGQLRINSEVGPLTLEALKARGHKLKISSGALSASPCAVSIDPSTGQIRAAGDPRAGRHAMAY